MVSALKVFAEKGFFGAKVADIAEDAGVADGTIYLYFRSKDDILISLFEHQMERATQVLREATSQGTTSTDKIGRFIGAYAEMAKENRHAVEVITIELRQSAKFMKEYENPRFAEFLKLIAQVIEEGQQRGELRADIPAPLAARVLFGALDELLLWWVSAKNEKLDIARAGQQLVELVLGGLSARPRARTT